MKECRKPAVYLHHLAYLEQHLLHQFCPDSCTVLCIFMSCAADSSLQCWCPDDCDGTWLQLQLWSLNHVGWEARSRPIPACQPASPTLLGCRVYHTPATGLCICLCWIHNFPNHPLSCLPSPALWVAAWPSSMPTAPSDCFSELAEISLHSLLLVLAKVLNNIGSSISGLLAGFYSAGKNPSTSQICTHFTFQLSSWHHISL